MTNQQQTVALGTMRRADKGVMAAPPRLSGPLAEVAGAVAAWPGVESSVHWHFADRSCVDGVDFYVGEVELGHLHLDGALHLATSPALGQALVSARLARRFPYQRGWVCEDVDAIGAPAAIDLFERNYRAIQAIQAIATAV